MLGFGENVHKYCDANNIKHVYFLIQGGGHDFGVRRPALWNFLQMADQAGLTDGTSTSSEPVSAFETIEAEDYNSMSGVQIENLPGGTQDVGYIENGDYLLFRNVDFGDGANSVTVHIGSPSGGCAVEFYLDQLDSNAVAVCDVPATGGFQTWEDVTAKTETITGKHDLYVKFSGGSGYLMNIDSFVFSAETVAAKVIRGDVDHSGKVDAADVTALRDYLLTKESEADLNTADLNSDGKLNVKDLTLLKRMLMTPPEEPRVAGQWYNTADISWIDASKPMAALSFDDAPVGTQSTATSMRIHKALKDNGFHATFFYVYDLWGRKMNSALEQEILQAQANGFEIGNHTYTHQSLKQLSAEEVRQEIGKNREFLSQLTGQENFLIRPPYLDVNQTVFDNAGAPLITCAVDTYDWNNATTAKDMVDLLTKKMNDGTLRNTIVLMHETYATTAEAVEKMAPVFKQNGWQVVTISEMFKVNGQIMKDGVVYTKAG